MLVGKVIGKATATVKHRSLEGQKLLLVQPLMADRRSPDGDPILVGDPNGASSGDTVLLSNDSKLIHEMVNDPTTPLRWGVLGIED